MFLVYGLFFTKGPQAFFSLLCIDNYKKKGFSLKFKP